ELPPAEVEWQVADASQPSLALAASSARSGQTVTSKTTFRVPKGFLELAGSVSCHRDEARWHRLYRVLWRLTHGEPHLLSVSVEPDVRTLHEMSKAVHRDVHKMRAFVRFREVATLVGPWLVAWYEPQHHVVEANAEFFIGRFAALRWSILTPERCLDWDTERLEITAGARREDAPADDAAEDLWRTYYRHIFNPARLKLGAMKAAMPRQFWKNLPEAEEISHLVAEASARTAEMVARSVVQPPISGRYHSPAVPSTNDWTELRAAAATCQACPLWQMASCTVFGEGPRNAVVMIVGEQPGDREDRAGRPFVGPAGQLLNRALREAGLDRDRLYLTNAVKHFKWTPRGKRRLHQNPNLRELAACRPWLEAEVNLVNPQVIVCLGASAARSVLGREVRVLTERGKLEPSSFGQPALVTVHPSSLLRLADPTEARTGFERLVADLTRAAAPPLD
ncbi:MAG TPA: UdgX family uracil-DNA binding protein, partial [Candidatus Synoicihabitans sp.]|nr:UdgX family uracil-DNA binding protein [Candidatus Synoicihabitans sp.]